MKKTKARLTVEIIIAAIIVISSALLLSNTAKAPVSNQDMQSAGSGIQAGTVSLNIGGTYASNKVSISEDETVLSVLQKLNAKNPNIKLVTKKYSIGTMVDSMGGIKNGTDGKYWQYKVNGVMPQVGAGSLKLKDGDFVDWFFGKSES